ncbi:hypothetical protein GW891_02555 [bacterium]|nr:hypothetical protein [bacterium]
MISLGYSKKSKYIEDLIPKLEVNTSETNTGVTEDIKINNNNITIDKFQKASAIIIKPTYVEKYNFITKDDILLE